MRYLVSVGFLEKIRKIQWSCELSRFRFLYQLLAQKEDNDEDILLEKLSYLKITFKKNSFKN